MVLMAMMVLATIAGEWIGGGATAFEKDFAVADGVTSAELAVTGLGYYEAYLDGRKIGDRVLDPSPTDYNRRVLFTRYPLELTSGRHTLRILLGHGWYDMRSQGTWRFDQAPWRDRPKTIAALSVAYADGRREVVCTDGSWQVLEGPIVYDCIREGEVVDGRKTWRRTGATATVVRPPAGKLEESALPPSKVVAEFAPERIYRDSQGKTIVVFPKTVAGWVRLKMRGQQSGDVVSIRYDENLDENGDAAKPSGGDRALAGKPGQRKIDCFFMKSGAGEGIPGPRGMQTDRYVANGAGEEVFEPRFVYHGFRYAVIEGLRRPLEAADIRACFVRTAFPESGSFRCSSPVLNELIEMARQSYLVNFTNGFPTDCPHREKLGWCNDAWIVSEMAQLYFDNAPAYLKWIRDIVDTQRADGLVCAIAPTSGKFGYEWGAGPLCGSIIGAMPHEVWRFKGERKAVERAYPALARYLAYEKTKETAPWVNEDGLGDWNANWDLRKHSPSVPFVVTCLCMRLREIAAEFATVLGDRDAAERFRDEARQTRAALRSRFRKESGRWDNATQTAQALAYMYRLWDGEAERESIGQRLVEAVEAQGRHFQGGQVGTKYVFRALSEIGRGDLALAMILNPTKPTMVDWTGKNGTLWEDFADGFSKAHVMLADFAAWSMEYVAGLREPLVPGCRRYLITPVPLEGLDWAEGRTRTPAGEFVAGWRREKRGVVCFGDVPAGATACLRLPDGSARELKPGHWEVVVNSVKCRGGEWLAKAEALKPTLFRETLKPVGAVRAVKDPAAFQGVRAEPVAFDVSGQEFILDFGRHLTGYFSLAIKPTVRPLDHPLRLRLRFAETISEAVGDASACTGKRISDAWVQDETVNVDFIPGTMRLPRRYAFRYVRCEVVEHARAKGKYKFDGFTAEAVTSADVTALKPLASDDPLERRMDRIAADTLRDCMQDFFEDGPKRDRRLWLGDFRLQALVNYETFRNLPLVRRCLYLFAAFADDNGRLRSDLYTEPVPHPGHCAHIDFIALYAPALLEYLEASGDRATAEDLWPVALAQIPHLLKDVDGEGLLSRQPTCGVHIDWSPKLDRQAATQGAILYGLKRTIALAERLGRSADVAAYVPRVAQMAAAARRHFWDPERRLFVSGPGRQVSYASQAWLVLAGVAAGDDARDALLNAAKTEGAIPPLTPYLSAYWVQALDEAGLRREARAALADQWRGMVEKGADTFWEAYDPKDDFFSPYGHWLLNSQCHAFSCAPGYFLRHWARNEFGGKRGFARK